MDVTEAIQKGFTILVLNEATAKMLRKKYDYPLFRSHRTKALDAVKGLLIDETCDVTKIKTDMDSVPVYFSKVSVNEYKDLLEHCNQLILDQADALKDAIALRMFCGYIQKYLQELEDAGDNVGLQPTIDNLIKLIRTFDNKAMEVGPFNKGAYMKAANEPFFDKENEVKPIGEAIKTM